ncbi:hypothetical protein VP01_11733g1, partial [Puccinia sorghi]
RNQRVLDTHWGKTLSYLLRQFFFPHRILQSRVNWNDAAFAFHFQKGLPSCITDQLALTGQRLKMLQHRKTNSTPSTSKNEDALKHKSSKKFPLKPSTPFALALASRPKKSTKIALVLNKEGQLNWDERARREKEGLFLYCGGKHDLDSCVKRITREAAKLAKK